MTNRSKPIDVEKLHAFEAVVASQVPGFQLLYKDGSLLMGVLGFFTYPFNPRFMTSFTTTLAPRVWFPSKQAYESDPSSSFGVLAHEMVHLYDSARYPILMPATVALPQLLAIGTFVAYGLLAGSHAIMLAGLFVGLILSLFAARLSIYVFYVALACTVLGAGTYAIFETGWLSLLLLASLVLLAPWPSPGRVHWELRGYTMQLALRQWITGSVPDEMVDNILKEFTGSNYYFMSWSPASMRKQILDVVSRAKSGELQTEAPYDSVYRFASENGLIPNQGS